MMDTVILTLNKDDFIVRDYDKFTPSARSLFCQPYAQLGASGYIRCVQNPTSLELKTGVYKPRLTLTKRRVPGGFKLDLRIEFSVPKIVFGNNFQEISETDFEAVISALIRALSEMSVEIKPDVLSRSTVSAIHYSKNLILNNHVTSSMIINELSRINFNARLDLNKTDYKNKGQAIHYWGNCYQLVIYDKVMDLQNARRSKNGSLEKNSFLQLKLPKALEVLRIECRLRRIKIKNLLSELGIKTDLTFSGLFRKDISKSVLLHFLEIIQKELNLLGMAEKGPEDIFQSLQRQGMRRCKILRILGLLALLNSIGIRAVRSLKGNERSQTWQRLIREVQGYIPLPAPGFKAEMIKALRQSLIEFSPIRFGEIQSPVQGGPLQ